MTLALLPFLSLANVHLDAAKTKIHFASRQGKTEAADPLLAFYSNRFKEWQEEQTRKNFGRPFVVGLIQLPEKSTWLFAGAYRVLGVRKSKRTRYRYSTEPLPGQQQLLGRIILEFEKPFRYSYPTAERVEHELHVIELRRERAAVADFPGYKNVLITTSELDLIIPQQLPSWRAALSGVSGVYLVVDRTSEKQYVGSAYGEGGIWSRWVSYQRTRHGNNKELITLLSKKGVEHAVHFQYSILEVCDLSYTKKQVLDRESHWKNLLLTRKYGHN